MKLLVKEDISLHIILTILLACFIIILGLIFIILLVPLRYKIDVNFNYPEPHFTITLRNFCYGLQTSRLEKQWMLQFLLFGFQWPLKKSSSKTESVQPSQSDPLQKTSHSSNLLKKLALDHAWKEHIGKLLNGIWNIIHPHKILVKARIGFSEPHYTGWLMALAGILPAMNKTYHIQLEGVWDEACLEGEIIIAGKLMLLQLLWQFISFILKPEVRSAYKRIRTQKSSSMYQKAA